MAQVLFIWLNNVKNILLNKTKNLVIIKYVQTVMIMILERKCISMDSCDGYGQQNMGIYTEFSSVFLCPEL